MTKYKLSQSTVEKLGYYVYLLIDPTNNKVFYVGKGHGNRINQHVLGALDENLKETEKIKRIRKIEKARFEVKSHILRHELSEKEAFEVESAIIDLLGKENLTNIVKGHHSKDKGRMTLEDIKIKYEAEEAEINEQIILININKRYDRKMNKKEIYEATRKHWRVNISRVSKIKIVCSVYRGIIREVFMIKRWLPSKEVKGRYLLEGHVAPSGVRKKYINKSVAKYWKKGSQNPIKYVNS